MDLEQFKRVEEIFEAAADLPPAERDAFLEKACDGDDALRRRVLRLLDHATRDFVCEDLADLPHTRSGETEIDDLTGTSIGPYELRELLGEGGFGAVYLAEQREPVKRLVALKIIKLGMDTKQVIARFEAERQALAMMEHPHIARVFDAGATDTGRPYFVMELVRGVPITRYCDEHRLSLRERLELFIQVCQAVQHAHQKGVIHRDLKPSNVMVTKGAPVPKIIDFGIAKATHGPLTERTLLTEMSQFIGTPEYMSPEQASSGESDIDTRSDIYSLGVLLYELLAGVSPFSAKLLREAGRDDLLRIIREQEPKKPSTHLSTLGRRIDEVAKQRRTEPRLLRRALRGDLDWIILKAMEKDPGRRYESAAELAHEIERYLHNRPIVARPPGMVYLGRKFVRRHRLAVGAAAVVALAVTAGLVAALVGLHEATIANEQKQAALDMAQTRLWEARLAQARAARTSNRIGRRFLALDAIGRAAAINPTPELRDEAIASMALPDFQEIRTFDTARLASASGLETVDRLAFVAGRGEIVVIAADDGHELARLQGPDRACWVIRFSRDGRYVAAKFHEVSAEAYFLAWDVASGEKVLEVTEGRRAADDYAFCSVGGDPALAVGGHDKRIRLFGLLSGGPVGAIELPESATGFHTDADGARLAATHFEEQLVTIWNVEDGLLIRTIDAPEKIRGMSWSADGSLLAGCGNKGRVYVWQTATGAVSRVLEGHQAPAVVVHFGSDGSVLASYGWDNTTRLWSLETGKALVDPLLDTAVVGFADLLVTSDRRRTSLWRYESAAELRRPRPPGRLVGQFGVGLTPGGDRLLTMGGTGLRLWDVRTGAEMAELTDAVVLGAYFSRGGRSVIAALEDGVHRWPIESSSGGVRVGAPERVIEQEGIRNIALAADAGQLAVCTGDRIDMYDLETLQRMATLPGYRGLDRDLDISPDGRWVFSGTWRGDPARLWDVDRREVIRSFPGVHVRGHFSPDGRWLIVTDGETFEIIETGSWDRHALRRRNNTDELAGRIAFSHDGRLAAVTHSRFEVQLIDIEANSTLAHLNSPEPAIIEGLAVDRDGSVFVASTAIDDVLIWDLARIRAGLRELGLDWADGERPSPGMGVAGN